MSNVINFPSKQQRENAGIEAEIMKVLDVDGSLCTDDKTEIVRLIRNAYDQYMTYSFDFKVSLPPDQPLTDIQIAAITDSAQTMRVCFSEHVSTMLKKMMMLMIENYKLRANISF